MSEIIDKTGNFSDKEISQESKSAILLKSHAVYCLFDFIDFVDLVRLQTLSKKLYYDLVPKYCVNGSRKARLGTFAIPETV